jgi:hypothetical protein
MNRHIDLRVFVTTEETDFKFVNVMYNYNV